MTWARKGIVQLAVCLVLFAAPLLAGQPSDVPGTLVVEVFAGGSPLSGATVTIGDRALKTNVEGRAAFQLAAGEHTVAVQMPGYAPFSERITVAANPSTLVRITLEEVPGLEETVIVTATRTNTRLQDQPMRVEVIDREEIEEKALMTPGSVAMLLGETTGLRVQTTSPALGAANVRIQGLRGRYSQLVADGLPLYGAQGDSFSLLQVPPLDLGQVEVIKGAASALYGASALGGVINLVSRRPAEAERELLVNGTSQSGLDLTSWLAQPIGDTASWSLLGGYHRQLRTDLDEDGWVDLPAFDRVVLRPRVFVDNGQGTSLFATVGVMAEDRRGGTADGRTLPNGQPFPEELMSRHVDGGFVGRWLVRGNRILAVRGSFMRRSQDRVFGAVHELGVRQTWFGEASLQGTAGRHTWVAGAALQQEQFDLRERPQFDYRFSTPSAFVQDDLKISDKWIVSVSARADQHSEYGFLATPRFSLLSRPAPGWIVRLSAGTGTFAPTPFTEETEETGLSRVRPLRGLRAERAHGASLDVTRFVGPIEITGTVFGSSVRRPVQRRVLADGDVELINASEGTHTGGTELLLRYRREGFVALATHAWTRSTELDQDSQMRRDVPLTPSHAGSMNAIWEGDNWGRFGIEVYVVGKQMLEENPYRAVGLPHVLVGALGERKVGKVRLFLNAENLLDVRQTRRDPLILPAPRPDGRWTVDAWAPLDGRVVNGGMRITF
ncbi:MAG TPA: TonB-dependent receptor [Vicinamibacterales bacterium]|nr:TonB-dependent receptor [Vicinamibacterales bacterium]